MRKRQIEMTDLWVRKIRSAEVRESGATRDSPILSSALPPGAQRLGDYTTRAAMGGVKQQNLAATPVMALLG